MGGHLEEVAREGGACRDQGGATRRGSQQKAVLWLLRKDSVPGGKEWSAKRSCKMGINTARGGRQ